MMLPVQAIEILLAAERQLVGLANDASGNRDYDGAAVLLEAARRVKMLGNGDSVASSPIHSPDSIAATEPDRVAPPTGNVSAAALPTRRARKSDYPRFVREGDSLVKIGWSRSEKSEYEHKSPRKVLLALSNALSAAGAKGRRFTMDKVLPLEDAAEASTLPDYQCYLCLAWLRQSGLVIQHGRQGYSLPKTGDLQSAIDRCWEALPNRD